MLIIVIVPGPVWLIRMHNISVRNSSFDLPISSLFPVHWHSSSCYCLDTYFDALLVNLKCWLIHLCVNTFFKTSSRTTHYSLTSGSTKGHINFPNVQYSAFSITFFPKVFQFSLSQSVISLVTIAFNPYFFILFP